MLFLFIRYYYSDMSELKLPSVQAENMILLKSKFDHGK